MTWTCPKCEQENESGAILCPRCGKRRPSSFDPQCDLYDRFVRGGETPDSFTAKRLYPALTCEMALARIERLRRA